MDNLARLTLGSVAKPRQDPLCTCSLWVHRSAGRGQPSSFVTSGGGPGESKYHPNVPFERLELAASTAHCWVPWYQDSC